MYTLRLYYVVYESEASLRPTFNTSNVKGLYIMTLKQCGRLLRKAFIGAGTGDSGEESAVCKSIFKKNIDYFR